MADIAESTPVAELNMEGAETKEAKTCELPAEITEKGDCDVAAGNEAEKETSTETADTTDASPSTGTKRKAEDEPQSGEAGEEPKKSKPDAEEVIAAEEGKDCEAVPANGVSSNGEETNGKAADDIPAEVVTKTVEDVLKPAEDEVEASS